MVLIDYFDKRIVLELLLVLLMTIIFISVTNSYSVSFLNKKSEYSNTYNDKFAKGYLTIEELAELKTKEKAYINNDELRRKRSGNYFGALALGMFTYAALIYFLRHKGIVKNNIVKSLFIVGIVSFVISGGGWQCIFWMLFFGFGGKLPIRTKSKIKGGDDI